MKQKIQAYSGFLSFILLISSCTSLGDTILLAKEMDAKYRAEALVSAGKDMYKDKLLAKEDVSAAEVVQRYFEAALRFDPENAEAAKYIVIVENYRDTRFKNFIQKAEALIAKEKRSADDEYIMLIAIYTANSIYPKDTNAIKLAADSADIRKAYVNARLEEAEAIKTALKPDSKDADKEKAYISAFNITLKAREIDPKDRKVNSMFTALKKDIANIVKNRLENINTLLAKASFSDANSVLNLLKDLDKKIDYEFASEIQATEYKLHLSWAKYHENRKEWTKANNQIKAALAVQRGSEALALQKRVSAAASEEEKGANFDAGLRNLDAYLTKNDLPSAHRLLLTLEKTANAQQKQLLDKHRKSINDALPAIYQAGVKAYKEERFKDAIASFEMVFAVSASYEEAADYLDKSRAKQKLLDQY